MTAFRLAPRLGTALSASIGVVGSVATTAAPPPTPTGKLTQFLTHDGDAVGNVETSSAPNDLYWNTVLQQAWVHDGGDWLDSTLAEQGSSAYGSASAVTVTGRYTVNVTALVSRWKANGLNRGFFLKSRVNAFPLVFAGRTAATVGDRPELVVVTTTGTFNLQARANASWATGTQNVSSSAAQWTLSSQYLAILQFDLSTVTGTVLSATLGYTLTELTQTGAVVDVFEANPPTLFDPADVISPTLGIGSSGNFATLISHPDILFADDFATPGPFDTGWAVAPTRTLDATRGTTYATSIVPVGALSGADTRINIVNSLSAGGVTNPAQRRDSAHATIRFRMESSFGGFTDRVKIPAMGSQLGYWNAASGGYWQPVTGNGGSPGTGLKVINSTTAPGRVEYEGHSSRLTTGYRCSDTSAYSDYVRLATYIYHLDQVGSFPTEDVVAGVVLKRGTWYDMSHFLQLNTMSGAQDGVGNYATANADGIYRLWINGYQVVNRTNYRWRRHAEFCVQGFWVDVYHGGTNPADRDMGFSVNELAVASSYIGPVNALPSWVPVAGGATTLTVTNGRLANNYRDVVNSYHSPFYAVKSVNGFNGAFLNPFWGDYGALLFWGGGHSDTNHNAMISLELGEVCTFKRLSDASPYYGDGAGLSGTPLEDVRGSNGIGYVIVDGKASGRNVSTGITSGNPYCESLIGDGAPNAPHSWGSGDVIAPADGGAAYGSFLQVLSQANTREENYSVNAAHRLDFATLAHGTGARSWVRASNNWDQAIPTASVPMHTAWVPAQRRVYTFGRASARQIRWYDVDAGTYTTGTGEGFTLDQASAPGGNGGGIVFHVPERNLLICCYGWPTLVVQYINVASGVAQPTRGGTATLSTPINVQDYFSSACWCPDNNKIIVGGLAAADQIAEISIPATLSDPWPSEVVAVPTGVIPFPLGDAGIPSIYKRWSYNPRIKSIAFMQRALQSGSDTAYVYRPRGT